MTIRLLIADDEPRNLTLLESYLAPLGHEIIKASSGKEALQAFERTRPDVVLLDVRMPELDGIDVLTHIRAASTGAVHVPVVLVTSLAEREDRLRGFEAGADEFLEKPVDRAILLARVRTLLRMKSVSDDLIARNDALERAQREQRELTAFIVHDLKSPISVAALNLAWVREQVPNARPDVIEALVEAEQAARRIQRMAEDMLAVSQLEEARLPLRRQALQIQGLLGQLGKAYAREAHARQVSLGVEADSNLTAQADPHLLRRVLENLVDNSLRHTPAHGRIAIEASGLAEGRNVGQLKIVVSNTGRAIPIEQRERIFDKYARGEDMRLGSAGLGLYFCRRVVELHGGAVYVEETDAWPVRVVVRLPTAEA